MVRRKRVSKGNWSTDNHPIMDGQAEIFRVAQSGKVWQFRMWIPEEQKAVRKSLKTRDLETAQKRARELFIEVSSNVQSGKKIFGASLQELSEQFVLWRSKDVEAGIITAGRLTTIKSQIKHFLRYKSPDLKLSELDRNSFHEYEVWRRSSAGGNAQQVTIRNEQATLNQMVAFAFREGYLHFDKCHFRPIRIKADEIGRRSIFTLEEYNKLTLFMRSYVSKKHCPNDDERAERLIVRDAIYIASNALLRPGELWQLKWKYFEDQYETKDGNGNPVLLAKLFIPAEISKVRRERTIISKCAKYLNRLKSNSNYTEPDDYLFTNVRSPTVMDRRKWDKHWKNLMVGIGIPDYSARQLTWYSLRHFGITCRIRAGVGYGEIADAAGTGVANIENHYGHFDDKMRISAAVKGFSFDKNGISYSY